MNTINWERVIKAHDLNNYDFDRAPFYIDMQSIRETIVSAKTPAQRKICVLYNHFHREKRPDFFIDNDLFLLPLKKGKYVIVKGDGYIDFPPIDSNPINHKSMLSFELETMRMLDTGTQHLDYAYATSILRTFLSDETLVLTIRGRKYTPEFSFRVGKFRLNVVGVQTEVDAGYEGEKQVVLVEAKNRDVTDVIIRQLFYPFRQWTRHTKKKVIPVFFDRDMDEYRFWQFDFKDPDDYNSIFLVKSSKYVISNS